MNKDYNVESIQNTLTKFITLKYVEKEGKKILEEARALKVENGELTKEENNSYISVSGIGVDAETLIEVAKSVRKIK